MERVMIYKDGFPYVFNHVHHEFLLNVLGYLKKL